jgi:hypothetical protein
MRILLAALALAVAAPVRAQTDALAGTYHLTGMREAAGGVRLWPDGRFEFGFTYGALDEMARGTWRRDGDRVILTSRPGPPPRMVLGAWSTAVDREYDPQAHPPALVVRVASPEHEVVWKGMGITAEYTGGATRTARTGRNGKATLPAVRGAAVRRVRVTDPEGRVPDAVFEVDRTARTLEVRLDPGNLVRPAFEQLALRVVTRGGRTALEAPSPDGRPGATFVRGEGP